jgi:tight adherence protein B
LKLEHLLPVILIASFGLFFLLALSGAELFSRGWKKYEERYLARTAGVLDEMFLPFTPEQVFYLNILSVVVFSLVIFLLTRSLFFGLLFGGFGYFLPRLLFFWAKRQRKSRLEEQLVDAIEAIANSLKSGFSMVQALELLSREAFPPISQEIALVVREVALGMNLEEALKNLGERTKSEDFDLAITAILISRGVGGNLAETFTRLGATIRQRNTIRGKIKSLTAQGKMQGMVIGSLPLVLGLVLYRIDPNMILVLFREPVGWAILAAVLLFEGIGAFFIWRIIAIDV